MWHEIAEANVRKKRCVIAYQMTMNAFIICLGVMVVVFDVVGKCACQGFCDSYETRLN